MRLHSPKCMNAVAVLLLKARHTLLGNLSYCQDRAGDNNKMALNYPTFLNQFAGCLPTLFQEQYDTRALVQDELQIFDDLMNLVRRSLWAIERDPNKWKTAKTTTKISTSTSNRTSTTTPPCV